MHVFFFESVCLRTLLHLRVFVVIVHLLLWNFPYMPSHGAGLSVCRFACQYSFRHLPPQRELPCLTHLVMVGNPIEQAAGEQWRAEVIRRLPNLKNLDGRAISGEERDRVGVSLIPPSSWCGRRAPFSLTFSLACPPVRHSGLVQKQE